MQAARRVTFRNVENKPNERSHHEAQKRVSNQQIELDPKISNPRNQPVACQFHGFTHSSATCGDGRRGYCRVACALVASSLRHRFCLEAVCVLAEKVRHINLWRKLCWRATCVHVVGDLRQQFRQGAAGLSLASSGYLCSSLLSCLGFQVLPAHVPFCWPARATRLDHRRQEVSVLPILSSALLNKIRPVLEARLDASKCANILPCMVHFWTSKDLTKTCSEWL